MVWTPKQSNSFNLTENSLKEMMTVGSELGLIGGFTSQSKEGHGSSYKEGAQEEKTREKEREKI